MAYLKNINDGCEISIYIQPNASKTEIVGEHNGMLKVKVQSPPVEGAANAQCLKFFADLLGVSKSKVKIIKGEKSRLKTILICEKKSDEIKEILDKLK